MACVEPSRRRQRGRRQHLRDLLLELHAPDLVALGRVLAVPRAVLVGDALLDLERGPVRGDRLPNKKILYIIVHSIDKSTVCSIPGQNSTRLAAGFGYCL